MLVALLDGRSLPAGELARAAGVSPSTGSEHLSRLTAGGLTTVHRCGRQRYYALSGEHVARALEALQVLAPARPSRSLRDHRAGSALTFARSCYDHLAGQLAIQLTDVLTREGAFAPLVAGEKGMLLNAAHPLLGQLGLDIPIHHPSRRPIIRGCQDWTERRPHLAGHLGAAVLTALTSNGWLQPTPTSRAMRLTEEGRQSLTDLLDIDAIALHPPS